MNTNEKKLIEFISTHNQFSDDSLLYGEISSVLKCSIKEAREYAKKHCNLLSFYALLMCQGYLTESYADFFKALYNTKVVNEKGYLNIDKEVILSTLGITVNIIETPFSNTYDRGFYQLKITNKHGDHFIACYSHGDYLYICDTNDRGIGVSLITGLKNTDKKVWLRKYDS